MLVATTVDLEIALLLFLNICSTEKLSTFSSKKSLAFSLVYSYYYTGIIETFSVYLYHMRSITPKRPN